MNKTAAIQVRMSDVRALHPDTLRTLAGPEARTLGRDLTPAWSFLAADCTSAYRGSLRELLRFFVLLPDVALIDFDIPTADPGTSVTWKLEGASPQATVEVRHLLHVIWLGEPKPFKPLDSIDLAGVRIGNQVVAFYTEPRMARSAVSFDLDGAGKMKILIAGLAPGEWEVWFAGMLEIPDGEVLPEAGTLAFEGNPGSYFIRRLGS